MSFRKICMVMVSVILFYSCTKNSNYDNKKNKIHTTSDSKLPTVTAKVKGGSGSAATVKLHRWNGKKQSGPVEGHPCECSICFGLCADGLIVDNGDGQNMSMANVIMKEVPGSGGTKITLYILTTPDSDVSVDPTLYVDSDVTVSNAIENIKIKAGAYAYSGTSGTVSYASSSYSYVGTVVVDVY